MGHVVNMGEGEYAEELILECVPRQCSSMQAAVFSVC